MKQTDDGYLYFDSGRLFTDNGLISVDSRDGRLYEGYDSCICNSKDLTTAERLELAEYMSAEWLSWAIAED